MGQDTKIQWCDHTFNPWRGCTKISPGCAHCYADAQSKRNPGVLGIWGDNGTRVVASEAKWREVVKWARQALKDGIRRKVFCASMADVFEDWKGTLTNSDGTQAVKVTDFGIEPAGLGSARASLATTIQATDVLDWLLLTKRPENAAEMLASMFRTYDSARWPQNIWLGTTVENQEQADRRIPILLNTPAPLRWLSMEPLLGPVDLSDYLKASWMPDRIVKPGSVPVEYMPVVGVDWVIVGGESGSKARPCDLDWIRWIVDQCRNRSVPVFVKQLGTVWARENGATNSHGGDPDEWPEDLRIREFPEPIATEAT